MPAQADRLSVVVKQSAGKGQVRASRLWQWRIRKVPAAIRHIVRGGRSVASVQDPVEQVPSLVGIEFALWWSTVGVQQRRVLVAVDGV